MRNKHPATPSSCTAAQDAWAYLRVSTNAQDVEGQEHSVLKWAHQQRVTISRIVRATVSSRKDEQQRGITILKEAAEAGQVTLLVFAELSRLGRSVVEIARLVEFFTEHGVRLVFIKEGMNLSAAATRDITSKVTLTILSLLAEIERDLISERTKAGLAAVRARGVRLGRKPGSSKLDAHEPHIKEWIALGVTQVAMARHVGCTPATMSNWLTRKRKQWKANKGGVAHAK